MRIKENRLVVTFHTTFEAMAFEEAAAEAGFKGRLIPVPTVITAGCGMAWSEAPDRAADLRKLIEDRKLSCEQIRELVI